MEFAFIHRPISVAATMVAALSVVFGAVFAAQAASPNDGIETAVRAAFADAPVMIAVAQCESRFRQFGDDGNALRGGAGKGYIGIFQIGESLHTAPAERLGHDIFTTEGNIGYARHLYDTQGATPWRECIPGTVPETAEEVAITGTFSFGARSPQIVAAQRILNAAGFTVAASGPGAPGNETDYFGSLTRDAVRRFQCAQGIVCGGSEWTTGYGRIGPMTRAALIDLATP